MNLPEVNIGSFLYYTYRENSTTFDDIGCYRYDSVNVTGNGQPENLPALEVNDGTLPLLGAQAELGRLFTRQDDTFGSPKTVVLSHQYWMRRFSSNPRVVGSSINVDGEARTIIGVLPRSFQFLDTRDTALYAPMQWDRSKVRLGDFSFNGLARLKPGVTLNQASADVARMIPIALHSYAPPPGFSMELFERANIQPNLRLLKQDVIGDIGKVLWVLMGSIGVVLLIACANVANLLLVRVEGRRQELAMIGVVTGVSVAAVCSRLMAALLFHVSAVDPLTYAVATLFILTVAAVSSYLPSRRAAVVNPVTALRSEYALRAADDSNPLKLAVYLCRIVRCKPAL